MTLTIIAAIMQGFEYHTCHQLQSIHPDITARPPDRDCDVDQVASSTLYYEQAITAISPYAQENAIVYNTISDRFHTVRCYAIHPVQERQTTQLERSVRIPCGMFLDEMLDGPTILIGASLARHLCLRLGDTVYFGYQSECDEHNTPMLDYTTLTVAGIYETGIEEQDMYLVYVSHETYEDIWDKLDISHIGISLHTGYSDTYAISRLSSLLSDWHISTWKQAYPALLSAMALEKYAMIAIFSLLLILASISSIGLLYMVLHVKSRECAILFTMGMPMSRIQRYFIIGSSCITIVASTSGIACGALISWIIDTFCLIPLPDVYYVTHLPAHVSYRIVATIWSITCIINICAAWLPSRALYKMDITRTLKGNT